MGKLHWKLLKDRRPVQTMVADRIAVRAFRAFISRNYARAATMSSGAT